MNRNNFIKTMAATVPAAAIPGFDQLSESSKGQVKITDVKLMRVQIGERGHVLPLVKIETDAGVYGVGECHHDVTGLAAKDVVLNAFKPVLMNKDPFDVAKLSQMMKWRVSYLGGNGGIGMHAVTGCEVALWDIVGKLTNKPLRKILGGGCYTDKVRAYLTSQPRNMLDKAVCKEWIDYVNGSVQKWSAAKPFRISRREGGSELNRRLTNAELKTNIQAFSNLREAAGDDFEIVVHCHWEFGFHDALNFARALEPIRPWWIEDPMPINYVDTWAKLTAASPIPILCGENLYTVYDFLPFITNQAVHLVEIDISMAGGLLEAKRIADLANTYYMPVATHNVMGPIATIASANCAATMLDFIGHESYDYSANSRDGHAGWQDLIIYDRDIIKDGYIQLSDKPGLGLEVNKDVATKYLVEGEKWWG
ncbi:MAG TPA: mandelate racemase/muconate lactonizing enzyme family protein [Bacteroidales bacterium]|nr:mandelate racemase/muconate lactonizing enzyme family protein [Bacteroidales bacterium]